jgi:hypothetical protein
MCCDPARLGALQEHCSIKLLTLGVIIMGTPHQGGHLERLATHLWPSHLALSFAAVWRNAYWLFLLCVQLANGHRQTGVVLLKWNQAISGS